jgi:hypothetical protein
MIVVGDSDRKPQHLPIGSLKFLGTNPYDEALFRVVWSESRHYLVGANHVIYDEAAGGYSDDKMLQHRGKDPNVVRREVGYKWLPLYPGRKCWILEKWVDPVSFTGCADHEQYRIRYEDPATKLMTLGPYPERGEFTECFAFPNTPTATVVHDTINRIRAGWKYSFSEHKAANEEFLKKKQQDQFNKAKDIFLDSQQAFKNRPSNVRPGKKTKDKVKLRYTADEVGLHKRGFSTVGGDNARNS